MNEPLNVGTGIRVEETFHRDVVAFVSREIVRFRDENWPIQTSTLDDQLERATQIAQTVFHHASVSARVVHRHSGNVEVELIDGELKDSTLKTNVGSHFFVLLIRKARERRVVHL